MPTKTRKDSQTDEDSVSFIEYDITTSANDFNIMTIFNFIDSGVIEIPGFQRNYIWDLKRASKLIESLIMGLPVPQIFLYEKSRNKFLVIDGQQRLMTIYYFIKKRFPKTNRRAELRKIFSEKKTIPNNILFDSEYFDEFNLNLPKTIAQEKNPLDGLNYDTLTGEPRSAFDLRPVRNIIVKQLRPPNEDSSIYEIFNRLNSGGVNLQPQEIRASLYHSDFYDRLDIMNNLEQWRKLYGKRNHPRMKDIETILRGFALLNGREAYGTSLNKFLNEFSRKAVHFSQEDIDYLYSLFVSFLNETKKLRKDIFFSKKGTFNVLVYEAIFYATCKEAYKERSLSIANLTEDKIESIKEDKKFSEASESETGKARNVNTRLGIAEKIIFGG